MTGTDFAASAEAAVLNGVRLTDDAEMMWDFERFPTVYALAILAQEEFAKALLLNLVRLGALPWSADLQRVLRDHICKQLTGMLLDHLCPEVDEFLRRHRGDGAWEKLPSNVLDAIHLIVHERIPKDRGRWWIGEDERPLDKSAKAVADGMVDRRKQDAIYVGVGSTGQVTSSPSKITKADANAELERAKRVGAGLRFTKEPGLPPHVDATKLVDIFRLLTNQLSPQEFSARWPVI